MKKFLPSTLLLVGLLIVGSVFANQKHENFSSKENMRETVKKIEKKTFFNERISSKKGRMIPSQAQEYLLLGQSVFNDEGLNVYPSGGDTISYPVYIDFNEENGTATFYNIFRDFLDMELEPVSMNWNESENNLKVSTPQEFSSLDECVYLGELDYGYDESSILSLQAGYPYGIGYWEFLPELEMGISSDRNVITSQSGFAMTEDNYDSLFEVFYPYSYIDALYNVRLYKRSNGIAIYGDKENIDFGETFVDTETVSNFRVVNAGTEEADFIISSTNSSFSTSIVSGFISPGEYVDINVYFNPEEEGSFNGEIIIDTEESSAKIAVTGEGRLSLDYKPIVTEGYEHMHFSTDNEYPFIITDEITGYPVAISTNEGEGRTSSWLEVEVNIPEGSRGEFNWKGFFNPRWAVYDYFIITDNESVIYETPSDDQFIMPIGETILLTPGVHLLKFTYKKGTMVNPMDVELGEDYTYIYDLSLTLKPYEAHSAYLSRDNYNFGTIYISKDRPESVSRENVISILNTGYENLNITEIKADNPFTATLSSKIIEPENYSYMTIEVYCAEYGTISGNITLVTDAGEFIVNCTADIMPIPDYSLIVKQGEFNFQVGENPFIIIDGTAVNDNTIVSQGGETISEFSALFTIPEGKAGLLTWEGDYDCGDGDMAMIMIDQDAYGMMIYQDGNGEASPYTFRPYQCWLEEGEHMISFGYLSSGTSQWEGSNTLAISSLSLEITDKIPTLVFWDKTPYEFTPVYACKYDKQQLSVYNLGDKPVSLLDVIAPDNFEAQFNPSLSSQVPPYLSLNFDAYFKPEKPGVFSGDFKVVTSAGEITIPVKGTSLDPSNILYYEDFENGLEGWEIIDANNDGRTWYEGDESYAHIGESCLVFNTFFTKIDSEDYVVSPEIYIPEEGATLTYYRTYTTFNGPQEYEVKVGEGDDPASYETVYKDLGISSNGNFDYIVIPLYGFNDETVRICFSNFSPSDSRNVLIIDDLVVLKDGTVNTKVITDDKIIERSFYTLEGLKTNSPNNGIYIVKDTLENGKIRINKVIFR